MDLITISSESLKGLWTIAGIVISGIVAWIGWSIKANIDNKYRENKQIAAQEGFQTEMNNRLEELLRLQMRNNEIQSHRLDLISEGLSLSIEANDVILTALHRAGTINGDAECEQKKLRAYTQRLNNEALRGTEISEIEKPDWEDLKAQQKSTSSKK